MALRPRSEKRQRAAAGCGDAPTEPGAPGALGWARPGREEGL